LYALINVSTLCSAA